MNLIMACIDSLEMHDPVLETAVELAQATDAHLIIAHVALLPPPLMYGEMMAGQEAGEEIGQRIRETRTRLDTLRNLLHQRQGLEATTVLLEGLKAPASLLEEADRLNPDLIVMGTHGYGPVARMFLGSTSQEIIRKGKWQVLLVPSSRIAAARIATPAKANAIA